MKLQPIEVADYDIDKISKYAKKMPTIFQYNREINKTAYMNWCTGFTHTSRRQFVVLREAYFSSAYNLVQQCLNNNDNKKADLWIFPLCLM